VLRRLGLRQGQDGDRAGAVAHLLAPKYVLVAPSTAYSLEIYSRRGIRPRAQRVMLAGPWPSTTEEISGRLRRKSGIGGDGVDSGDVFIARNKIGARLVLNQD
jgi:hypothetical protein